MSAPSDVITIIKEMGAVHFRKFLFNHPDIVSFFDQVGETMSFADALETLPSGPLRDWVIVRQDYLHAVVDRNLAAVFAGEFAGLDDLIAGLKMASNEVVAYVEANNPLDYRGEKNAAFSDGCHYQLMRLTKILETLPPLDEAALKAMRQDKPDWLEVDPQSADWMNSTRDLHRRNPESAKH